MNSDIVINSGDLNRNGANHWQIINSAPWRRTLLVYLDFLEETKKKSGGKEKISRQHTHTVQAICVELIRAQTQTFVHVADFCVLCLR